VECLFLTVALPGRADTRDVQAPSELVPPGRRVIENKHSNRDRSVTYGPGEWSYIRAEEKQDIRRRSSA